MILLSLLVFLFGQQIANGIGCENGQMQNANYTLSVAAFVGDNNITLTCTSSEMLVTSKKYLKWTEKGRELPNSYHVSRNGTTVTINITNASYLDIGVYTCRCYNNYSVAEIEEIYYSDHKYYHHCSEPFSIQAVASASSDQLVTISDHIVETFNAVVEINCTDETNLLHDTSHSSENIEFPLSVIVNSPSKQGKYVCIDQNNNMLKEIHYIQVKDYEAPVFLIPSSESSVIDSSLGTVPVCVVYSSLPVTFLQYSVRFSNSVFNLGDNDSLTTGLYLVADSGSLIKSLKGHLDHCIAKTVWETVEISYDLQINDKPFVPSVCLSASVDPYATEIAFGESFTVHCVLYSLSDLEGKIVEILHININGTQLSLNYSEFQGHDVHEFMAVVNNVSESNIGEYICMFRLDTAEYQLRENDSITINSILRPTVSKAVPPLTSIPVQVSVIGKPSDIQSSSQYATTIQSSSQYATSVTTTLESVPQLEDQSYRNSLLIIIIFYIWCYNCVCFYFCNYNNNSDSNLATITDESTDKQWITFITLLYLILIIMMINLLILTNNNYYLL